ncbi:kelch-like protein 10 [Solea solea]|uniref:kelch-like protein 10 n=1 Tax=Solea solea TaxID=90069 RepID=UPI00272B24AD|nr:kelch-like protein 10 [Solea solea]
MTFRGQSIPRPHSTFDKHRLGGKFLDAIIRVEGVEYKVHRIILSDCSPYFTALFQFQSPVDIKVSDINGLSTDIMELIVEYAYTSQIHVTKDNVQDLMQAADMLSVTAVAEACSDFLCEQISRENCIGMWQYAKFYFYTELRDRAYRYINDHFDEVFPCEEFLYLSMQELSAILGRDDLNVRKEYIVFEAILRWIEHNPEERERHIVDLLSKFRMALTSIDYIQTNVLSNELVETNAECKLMATDAIHTIEYITQTPSMSFLRNTLARPRLPNAIMLATGGWRGENPVEAICAYDIFSDSWVSAPYNLEYPRAYHGTVFLKGYLYCLGGSAREEYFNSVSRLDLRTHRWDEVAPMYYSRCYVSSTELNGFIYAMGGFDGHSRLNSAERYNPDANQWKRIAPMHHPRSDASCTTLHNKVYICGGFDGNECLQTAECYNPETNQWTVIAPMNERRSGIGVITLADQIYAVGGCDGTHRLNTTEVYNPLHNTWNLVCPMMTTRSNFGVEVIYDQIFVVGGYTGTGTTSQVEYYDSTVDRWYGASEVTYHGSALSCCVLFGLPDITSYAVPRDSLPFI